MNTTIDYSKTYSEHIQNKLKKDSFLRPYFLTVSFDDFQKHKLQSTQVTDSKINTVWRQYGRFNRHLVSNLMNNFTKKIHLHPRTFDFIDFPGTRHSRSSSFHEPQTPHVHSVYLIHPDTLTKFQHQIDTDFKEITGHRSMYFVQSVHAVPITHNLPRVVSYSSKFLSDYRSKPFHSTTPLSNQYSIAKSEKKVRKNSSKCFYVDQNNQNFRKRKRRKKTRLDSLKERHPKFRKTRRENPHESYPCERNILTQ